MMQTTKWMSAAGGLVALTVSSICAAELPPENRLSGPIDSGAPAVTFEDIAISYKPGKTKRKGQEDSTFFAESTNPNGFGILGSDGNQTYFTDGYLALDAKISPKGTLKPGGYFEIWSSDSMFNDGSAASSFNCNNAGNNCQGNGWLVYGADLYSFGWGSEGRLLNDYAGNFWGNDLYGVLEFGIYNQSGWAWDQWGSGGPERIIFGILDGFDLNGANAVTSFNATARGMAVVPVPAAVWLFGSGLLGLFGLARRRKHAA